MAMNEILRALADPTRREILRLLRRRDLSAGEISQRFPLSRSTLSSHFNTLRSAGLVVSERQGTSIVYSLNLSVAEEALGAILDLLAPRHRRRVSRAAKGTT